MPQANDAVWVDVLPSMKSFGPALAHGAEKDAVAAGAASGKKFGKAMLAGIAIVGGGAALAGKALYGLGKTFDDLKITIQQGTGASGKALDGLMDSAKNVGKKIPANFDDIGKALADLNTQTGASGKTLEGLTSGVLEASRALGENGADNAALFGQTLNQANIPAKDGRKLLDKLYVASQKYGTSLGGMMKNLKKFGPQMQSAGLSMDQTIDLFGQFNKAGVSANRIVPSLNAAMIKWAKSGKDPAKMLQNLAKKVANAKTQQEAMQAVSQDMSGPGASAFVTAIRKSGVSLDGLGKSLKGSGGAVKKASGQTQAFSEKWQVFKNNVMVGLQPLATKLFDAIAKGMDWINKNGIPALKTLVGKLKDFGDWIKSQPATIAIFDTLKSVFQWMKTDGVSTLKNLVGKLKDFGNWLSDHKTLVQSFAIAVGLLTAGWTAYKAVQILVTSWTKIMTAAQRALNLVMKASVIGLIVTALTLLVFGLIQAYKHSKTFRDIVNKTWTIIKKVAKATVDWFMKTAWPWMKKVFQFIGDKATWLWKKVLKPTFDGIWKIAKKVFGWIKNTGWPWIKKAFEGIGSIIKGTWNKVVKPTFKFIKSALTTLKNGFVKAKNGIKTAFEAVGAVVKRIWNAIKTDFGYIKSGVGKVKDAFVKAKDGITSAWEKVKAAARKPVAFVINHVVRPFLGGINKILGFVHLPKIPRPAKMATGGVMPGYTPGRDVHQFYSPTGGRLDLSGGEAVMRPEFTRAIGQGGVNALNRAATHGGPGAVRKSLGLKDGGVLPHRRMFWGGVWDKVKSAGSWLKDHTIGAAKAIWDFIRHPKQALTNMLGKIGNSWPAQIVKTLPGKLATGLKNMISKAFGGGGSAANYKPGAGVKQWSGVARRAMAAAGLPDNFFNLLMYRMNVESGGNPRAINLWDSNAAKGQASRGLMQTIPSTFAAYAGPYRHLGIFNPLANIYAAIKYSLARYGLSGLANAWGGTGGYKNGTLAAQRGIHQVAEDGAELVVGRQLMRFNGGEGVFNRSQMRSAGSGSVDLSDRTLSRLADAVAQQVIEMDGQVVAQIMAGHMHLDRASQRIAAAGTVSA